MYIFSRDQTHAFCNNLFKTRLHLLILAIVLVLLNISNDRLISVSLSERVRNNYQGILRIKFKDNKKASKPQNNRSLWLSGRASASESGGRGFESRPRHTKGVKNGTSGYLACCSAL